MRVSRQPRTANSCARFTTTTRSDASVPTRASRRAMRRYVRTRPTGRGGGLFASQTTGGPRCSGRKERPSAVHASTAKRPQGAEDAARTVVSHRNGPPESARLSDSAPESLRSPATFSASSFSSPRSAFSASRPEPEGSSPSPAGIAATGAGANSARIPLPASNAVRRTSAKRRQQREKPVPWQKESASPTWALRPEDIRATG